MGSARTANRRDHTWPMGLKNRMGARYSSPIVTYESMRESHSVMCSRTQTPNQVTIRSCQRTKWMASPRRQVQPCLLTALK